MASCTGAASRLFHYRGHVSFEQFFPPCGSKLRIGQSPETIPRNDSGDTRSDNGCDSLRHIFAAVHDGLRCGEAFQAAVVHVEAEVLERTSNKLRQDRQSDLADIPGALVVQVTMTVVNHPGRNQIWQQEGRSDNAQVSHHPHRVRCTGNRDRRGRSREHASVRTVLEDASTTVHRRCSQKGSDLELPSCLARTFPRSICGVRSIPAVACMFFECLESICGGVGRTVNGPHHQKSWRSHVFDRIPSY
mmetsp:Transcript_12027/g.28523  ORF Transcript_12027/g.28523 Transcript_12027/m.28523 type:complete len:247 (+) Transcript_12027:178-918(+)